MTSAPRGTSRRRVQLPAGATCPPSLAGRGWWGLRFEPCPGVPGARRPERQALEPRSKRHCRSHNFPRGRFTSPRDALRRTAALCEAWGLTPKFHSAPPPEGCLPGGRDRPEGLGHRAEMPASPSQERCLPSPGKTAPGKGMKRYSVRSALFGAWNKASGLDTKQKRARRHGGETLGRASKLLLTAATEVVTRALRGTGNLTTAKPDALRVWGNPIYHNCTLSEAPVAGRDFTTNFIIKSLKFPR